MKINFGQVTTVPLNSTWPGYHDGSVGIIAI